MKKNEVHLEHLLGRRVVDADGVRVGPLEEIIAEEEGGEWVIKEYLVGRRALLERLSVRVVGRGVLKFFRVGMHGGYRVSWEHMDLSDPRRLRLHCSKSELKTFNL